jgi:hypothetical protein
MIGDASIRPRSPSDSAGYDGTNRSRRRQPAQRWAPEPNRGAGFPNRSNPNTSLRDDHSVANIQSNDAIELLKRDDDRGAPFPITRVWRIADVCSLARLPDVDQNRRGLVNGIRRVGREI